MLIATLHARHRAKSGHAPRLAHTVTPVLKQSGMGEFANMNFEMGKSESDRSMFCSNYCEKLN
jgi:hypothetical protein